MIGVEEFISTEMPVICNPLKSNKAKVLARRYEKMYYWFHFLKPAKSAGNLKLSIGL